MTNSQNSDQRLKKFVIDLDHVQTFLSFSVIALAVASGVATYEGALRLVSGRQWVALCFTCGIQGGSLATAHLLSLNNSTNLRSKAMVFVAWLAATWFSVFTSSLGIMELQRAAIQGDHSHAAMQADWNASGDALRQFYTGAGSWVADNVVANQIALRRERTQELAARAQNQKYSTQDRDDLRWTASTLAKTQKQLSNVMPIGSVPPISVVDARGAMDRAFDQAASIYANMPGAFRATHSVPTQPKLQIQSEDPQDELVREIQSGSIQGRIILGIAVVLDLLPVLLYAALKRRRSAAQWIRDRKRNASELVAAVRESKPRHVEHLRILIEPYNIFGTVSLGSESRMVYPEDLSATFEQFEKSISQELGLSVSIVSIMTSSGAEIVPELPLLGQLEGDLIRLKVEAKEESRNA